MERLPLDLVAGSRARRRRAAVAAEAHARAHRHRARARHYGYEAATVGRRTQNWNRSAGDANTVNGFASLQRVREVSRDLVRNNPYAESALATIADHTVGWGIVAKPKGAKNQRLADAWKAWAESTDCDADGRHDLYGLQKIVMKAVAESGEVLIRRRWRYLTDGLAIPMQLQVLESDFLDAYKTIAAAERREDRAGRRVRRDRQPRRVLALPESPGRGLPADSRADVSRVAADSRERDHSRLQTNARARCAPSRGSRRSSCG
jgi:capsid protein